MYSLEETIRIIDNTKEERRKYHQEGSGERNLTLTEEQIKALKEGKALAFSDGEYTWVVQYKV